MMELSRISLVCWHLFEREDLDVRGDAAILGRNRAGKSTLIDLIQTVMTGASGGLYRFNRSAGDGSGKSERTLRGYCLGQLNEHEAIRTQGITHIALGFEDRSGGRQPVTVGLCLEVPPNEDSVIVRGRYVADGLKIDSTSFVEQANGGLLSAPWSVLLSRLERDCAAPGKRLLTSDTSRAHIREYMRLLFSGRRSPDPDRFARAFVLALSFEDIKSVEFFVRNFLLEKKDINIGELRESIQRYRQIQKDIQELKQKLEELKSIQALIATYDDLLRRERVTRGVERLASLVEAGSALFDHLKELRDKTGALQSGKKAHKQCEAEIGPAEERLQALRAQLVDTDANRQKRSLDSDARNIEKDRSGLMLRLRARFASAAQGAELLRNRERLHVLRIGEVLNALDQIQAQSAGLTPPDWPRDANAMEKLIARAGALAAERLSSVTEERNEAIALERQCRNRIGEYTDKIEQARRGVVDLDPQTLKLMELLQGKGMRPRVLCQMLDVADEEWRHAAEALLGRDRETILVDPQHASRAVELLRAHRNEFRACRVANTRRLESESRFASPGTLAATFRSDDPFAMAFVVFRLGNIRLAASQEELLRAGRAVMKDGAYYDGLVVGLRHPDGLKIGRAAAVLMRAELERELAGEKAVLGRLGDNVKLFDDALRRLEQLSAPMPEDERLEILIESIAKCDERLADIHALMAQAASQIEPALRRAHDEAKARVEALQSRKDDLRAACVKLETEIAGTTRRLNEGEGHPGSRLSVTFRRQRFRQDVGNLALFAAVRVEYERLRGARRLPARIAQEVQQEADDLVRQYRECESDIRDDINSYRRQFNAIAPSGPERSILVDMKPWVDESIAMLENNQLIQYQRQADEAADQIGRLLRTGFIHELNARFNALEAELDELTKALRTRPLHGETYRLRSTVKPEFDALYRLARESETDETVLESLFGRGNPRDERHAAAVAQVERLLGDEGGRFEDFQDYRNYYAFDLTMRDVASGRETSFERRRGVASGAERQVPFYVIIGAALANLYHGARRPGAEEMGIGLATFDEAFSKMDGPNQRTLLDFYRDIGLQVLIAAPTEKRAVVYENLDSIIDVHRHGDRVSAETTIIKEPARAAIRDANPEYMSEEALRAKFEASLAGGNT